jgi:hypothetical protein
MGYRLLVDVILVAHFAYLCYLALGGFVAWRWPRAFWPHLLAAAWGFAIVVFSLHCPLTWAEDRARRRAGEAALTKGFIDRYIKGVIYPERYTDLLRVLVVILVLGSWTGVVLRWRSARRPASAGR